MSFIPESAWGKTPVALRATAGLRLLPHQEAEKLLEEVGIIAFSFELRILSL